MRWTPCNIFDSFRDRATEGGDPGVWKNRDRNKKNRQKQEVGQLRGGEIPQRQMVQSGYKQGWKLLESKYKYWNSKNGIPPE